MVIVLTEVLQLILITIPVSFFVCPHFMCLCIRSVFYRNLHTWMKFIFLVKKITGFPNSSSIFTLNLPDVGAFIT